MVCVLSMAAGVSWVGLNMKMQPWVIPAAPLLYIVRSICHACNLWGSVCVCLCVSVSVCQAVCTVALCVVYAAFKYSVLSLSLLSISS